MSNKVLVKIIIPEFEMSFDVFLPVSEVIWKIKKMIIKVIGDITNIECMSGNYIILNKINNRVYKNNETVINTDIRNCSELIMLSNK